MRFGDVRIISLVVSVFALAVCARADITVDFLAETSAGWDLHGLETDIARNNTIDWNDLNIIAQHWLNSDCNNTNQWCAGADLDGSSVVDFFDYTLLANDWDKQAGDGVSLQTIYGTSQDSNGTITANSYRALSEDKGMAMAFAVPANTAIDKAIFKCFNFKSGDDIRIRLFNVTGLSYLSFSSHPTLTKSDPGSGRAAMVNYTVHTPGTIPYHSEPDVPSRKYTDMVINFGQLWLTVGEYFLTIDNLGDDFTVCSMVKGTGATDPVNMGKFPDGTPLPNRATVTTSSTAGNTYYYYLSATDSTNYSVASDLFACQLLTVSSAINIAPQVNAGQDQTINSPDNTADLDGTVTDDGLPNPPGVVTTQWTKQSGPGTVIFDDANTVDTAATFSELGQYVLRLTANDSELSNFDEVTISYVDIPPPPPSHPQNETPFVNAGSNLQVTLGTTVTINATVTDDGKPTASVTKSWSKVSGPGTVTFGSPSAEDTTVSFSAAGTYVLRLTASDSLLTNSDDITVTVWSGSVFYVSPSGNNGNAGTIGSPWKTIQYAVDNANVTAGSTIFVRAGTYNEQVAFNKSGSDTGGYIILRNYGSEVPILDGAGTEHVGIPALITIDNQHHIFVCGFEIRNLVSTGRDDTPAGIYLWSASHHIYLCGNNVHNIQNGALSGNAHGIACYGTSTSSQNNLWIEDNIVSNCVLGTSESLVLNGNVEIFTVKDNIVHDNDNIGIDFIGFEGTSGGTDQARNGSCIRNTVYNIDFSKNRNYTGDKNADGIYVDGGTNIIIEKNIVHNCNLGIEAASEHHGHTTDYITVRSNLIYNCDVGGLFFGGYDSSVGSAANCAFVNNTLYNNNIDNEGWGGEIVMQWHCSNNVVKNNAVYATAGQMLIDNPDTGGSNNVFDYNVYYGAGATWLWKNVEYSTFAAYKTACGQETHSLNTDPGYADAPNLDLHIWTGSACVNAGDPSLSYTGLQDIDGQARKTGSNADIGADETLAP